MIEKHAKALRIFAIVAGLFGMIVGGHGTLHSNGLASAPVRLLVMKHPVPAIRPGRLLVDPVNICDYHIVSRRLQAPSSSTSSTSSSSSTSSTAPKGQSCPNQGRTTTLP